MPSRSPALLPFETQPIPLPTASCDKMGLLYHPVEKSLWLLAFGGALWRYQNQEWSLVANAPGLMPDGYSPVYSWGHYFYWDGARKAPVCFATGYGGTRHPVMGVWNGKRFETVIPGNPMESSNRDAFAFDAGRNVLVHFVATRDADPRFPSGTLHARELDAKGAWRDVELAQKVSDPVNMMAGYDGSLGATVCITADASAFAWNGTAWKPVPVEASSPWFPYATAPGPGTRGMVFVHVPRETGDWPAECLEVSGGKLRERPVTAMRLSGGMAHDSDRDVTYVFGPWFGDGTLQYTLGTYAKGTFSPAGRVAAGQAPLIGPGFLFGDEGRSTHYWLRVGQDPSTPMAEVLPPPPSSIGYATTRAGIYAVESEGAASRLAFGGTAYAKNASAPKGFPPRSSTCLGADYQGDRVLLVSGQPASYGPYPKDAWLLGGGAWHKLAITGAAPALAGAAMAYDADRTRWVLAGGRDKSFKEGLKTFETDEKKWRSFPSKLVDGKGKDTGDKHVGLMAYDPVSRQIFCLAGLYEHDHVYVYEGEGVWRLLTEAPAMGAFDVETRRLAWRDTRGDGLVKTLDLGALLDGHAASHGKASKAPAAPVEAAKPSVPDQVWLRYQDGSSDKVWFAKLEKSSFTVRFGKRGGTLQEKTTRLQTVPLARARYQALVQEKLAKGYEPAPEGEAIASLPGLRAWHMTGRERTDDVWGGVPQGVPEEDWPVCAECKTPLIHVVTLHAHPERLPLKKNAALMAFICGTDTCEFWEADTGANRVLLRTAKDLAKVTLKAPPRAVLKAKQRTLAYQEVFEVDQEREPNAASPETCDKVGGYPAWLQGDTVPACKKCRKPMRFVAQMNEHDLNFTGGGMAYIFVCHEEHTGVLLMQR